MGGRIFFEWCDEIYWLPSTDPDAQCSFEEIPSWLMPEARLLGKREQCIQSDGSLSNLERGWLTLSGLQRDVGLFAPELPEDLRWIHAQTYRPSVRSTEDDRRDPAIESAMLRSAARAGRSLLELQVKDDRNCGVGVGWWTLSTRLSRPSILVRRDSEEGADENDVSHIVKRRCARPANEYDQSNLDHAVVRRRRLV